jgi:hypothetical protein
MGLLKPSDFEPLIHTSFAFANESEGEPNESDLILTKVTRYELHPKDRRSNDITGKFQNEPFSLFFEGDHARPLESRSYALLHQAFPDGLDLFLSCKGPTDGGDGFIYEAVFS